MSFRTDDFIIILSFLSEQLVDKQKKWKEQTRLHHITDEYIGQLETIKSIEIV